ncbi:fibronectin-binding domain-containing protein [Methanothermobacter thermautotrophicus]|uniref:Archaeal Rqc2 homolog aRqcH n=1 Tax=Methanothermobacter thermautotrophicus TaxID=145262 RepID=A0A842YIS6_METTF|nr:ribosome rescue protein RqcH [Methanothermobacter thermautotrophicus]MBE2899236.1 fibronectin-binding domain-containing protein [Methanothermobacter thermautotrophicus]MCQ8904599.1 NFACT family protein [Methanothermobacter sp.]
MKTMSNVDVFAVTSELNEMLRGARVDKAYQPLKDTVIIRFHVPGEGRVDVVMQAGARIHRTNYPPQNPKVPPSFPMLLRKHLRGGIVREVRQHGFDRIVEITVEKDQEYTLIVELFAKGNIILLNQDREIILPLKRKTWSDRRIASREIYEYPPSRGINPLDYEPSELEEILMSSDADLIRTLARSGFGGLYAEEIVLRAGLDKNTPCSNLSMEDVERINAAIGETFKDLRGLDLKPQIIGDGEDVLPIELMVYQGRKKKYFESFNDAADEFFSSIFREEIRRAHEEEWEREVDRFRKRLRIQRETLEKFKKTIEVSTRRGDLLYANYSLVEDVLATIRKAREKYSWDEIKNIIADARKRGLPEARNITEIDRMGNLTLLLDGEPVRIDSKLGVPENAEVYYEKAKKAKRKINGVMTAIERTEKEIERIERKRDDALRNIMVPRRRVKRKLRWFEKFRWFVSSDGFLVIGGRDAGTNEIVVKKHMEPRDIYLHSDIHGAPSVVIKSGGRDIPETTIQEAAVFAASFSSAWTRGFTSLDVYWVHPEQVTKTPKSGEFVARGAFIIRGPRNYLRGVPLKIAIGVVDYEGERVMSGPPSAVKRMAEKFVTVKPGYTKKEALAKAIKSRVDDENLFPLEDFIRNLPPGKGDIVEED